MVVKHGRRIITATDSSVAMAVARPRVAMETPARYVSMTSRLLSNIELDRLSRDDASDASALSAAAVLRVLLSFAV